MARKKKPKIDPDPSYRWCDKQDKYIPVSACKEKTKVKARCRKCYQRLGSNPLSDALASLN